jgi:uncharacterized protein
MTSASSVGVTQSVEEEPVLAQPVAERLTGIRELARGYGVRRLEVFGSACTRAWDPERSDVDFLVEYPPGYDFGPVVERFLALEADLAALLGRKVELVMTTALRNPYFIQEAAKTRTVVYDASEDVRAA